MGKKGIVVIFKIEILKLKGCKCWKKKAGRSDPHHVVLSPEFPNNDTAMLEE